MNRAAFEIDTDALHAYADGQLTAEQNAAVEAYLAEHPDAAALVAQWQRQNDAMRVMLAFVLACATISTEAGKYSLLPT